MASPTLFARNWWLGRLDGNLALNRPQAWTGFFPSDDLAQVVRIAEAHGFTVTSEPFDEDWTRVALTAVGESPAGRHPGPR